MKNKKKWNRKWTRISTNIFLKKEFYLRAFAFIRGEK